MRSDRIAHMASPAAAPRAPEAVPPILEARGLTKHFKGLLAVDKVDLTDQLGSIHAMIVPNGAGKTTVFNLITGFLRPSAGTILFAGDQIEGCEPAQLARRGIVRSFQISSTFPGLSALENVRVALQTRIGTFFHFWRSERTLEELNAQALALLETVNLRGFAGTAAGQLAYGQKRALELATTLAMDPQLMLLDEPTQGMGHEDVARVVELIRKISQNRTVLMVEHNLSVVADLCDCITVLQRGCVLAEGSYAEVSRNPAVLEAYLGAEHV
jgi:branched-chain amino acid transport system ATP-binding protein